MPYSWIRVDGGGAVSYYSEMDVLMDAIVSGVMLEHGQQCDLPGMPVGGVLNRSVEES